MKGTRLVKGDQETIGREREERTGRENGQGDRRDEVEEDGERQVRRGSDK